MTPTLSRKLIAALLAVTPLVAACEGPGEEGMVLMIDRSYRASVAAGSGDGFASPDGLLWQDGRLYVADEGGSALRVWTEGSAPRTLAHAGSGISSPEDVARDPQGNIYFTDDSAGGLWKVDPTGRTTLLAGKDKGLVSTEGIALTPSGDLLVGDQSSHRILAVDASTGAVSTFLGPQAGIGKPESMAFDDQGNLYIADNEADILHLLTRDGVLHRPIENRDGFSPESLSWARGVLYVTDSENGKLYRYTPEDGLDTIAVFGGTLAPVHGITTDDRGSIYLSVQSDLQGRKGYILRLDKKDPR